MEQEEENPIKVRLEYWRRNQLVAVMSIAIVSFVLCLIIAGVFAPEK